MFVRYFVYILTAAVASALLGGGFAYLLAALSPEFVTDLFPKSAGQNTGRYAAAVGMVWGLFIGAAVMAFCLLLATIHQIVAAFRKANGEAALR